MLDLKTRSITLGILFAVTVLLITFKAPTPIIVLISAAMMQFWLMSQPPQKRDRKKARLL